jgi:hypothetical protein
MGYSAKQENVLGLLQALEQLFLDQQLIGDLGNACEAANAVYISTASA